MLFGDAIRPGSGERLTAKKLSEEWSNRKSAEQSHYDGYYAAIHYSREKGLIAGGDILGLFPIYYYSKKGITLIGSSPELFKYHQCFNPELSIEGLTGMLMTMHSVQGLSLWEGVRRLQHGYLLVDDLQGKTQEVLQYEIPQSNKYYNLSFSQQLKLIYSEMKKTIARHAPAGKPYSFLFSGGLDSRMLAGFLKERQKMITAVTLGKPTDIEMKIAKKTMKALPFRHKCIERSFDKYLHFANISAKWEHGLNGFNGIHFWSLKTILQEQEHSRIISGICHDTIFSGTYADSLQVDYNPQECFSEVMSKVTEWGISRYDLNELLLQNNNNKGVIKFIYNKLEEKFSSLSNSDRTSAWLFELFHRGRFHLGGMIWKMSFGAWPVVPVIDSSIIEIMAGLPWATKANRRAQRALVSTYFPDLARIPLDNNSTEPELLIPTWQFLLRKSITESKYMGRILRGIKHWLNGPWYQNLYYHRITNINNSGWRGIRQEVESTRMITSEIFDQDKLRELVPSADENIHKRLEKVSGMKSLLGFLFWLKSNKI